jgi:hypothetical protein
MPTSDLWPLIWLLLVVAVGGVGLLIWLLRQ